MSNRFEIFWNVWNNCSKFSFKRCMPRLRLVLHRSAAMKFWYKMRMAKIAAGTRCHGPTPQRQRMPWQGEIHSNKARKNDWCNLRQVPKNWCWVTAEVNLRTVDVEMVLTYGWHWRHEETRTGHNQFAEWRWISLDGSVRTVQSFKKCSQRSQCSPCSHFFHLIFWLQIRPHAPQHHPLLIPL